MLLDGGDRLGVVRLSSPHARTLLTVATRSKGTQGTGVLPSQESRPKMTSREGTVILVVGAQPSPC